MTAKSQAALISEIDTNFADNTIGNISAALLRSTNTDLVQSAQQTTQVNAQTGTSYTVASSTATTSDYGQLVTFSNSSPVAVTLGQASASGFTPFNFLRRLSVPARSRSRRRVARSTARPLLP